VLYAPEIKKYAMYVAEMTNHCNLGKWRTNSEVALAYSESPEGPFLKQQSLVPPWAHNPEAIRAPDPVYGYVYALYTLGNGVPEGEPADCNQTGPSRGEANLEEAMRLGGEGEEEEAAEMETITANFTIHWAHKVEGPYQVPYRDSKLISLNLLNTL